MATKKTESVVAEIRPLDIWSEKAKRQMLELKTGAQSPSSTK